MPGSTWSGCIQRVRRNLRAEPCSYLDRPTYPTPPPAIVRRNPRRLIVWYSIRCARTTSEVTLTITRHGSPKPVAAATATAPLGAISPKGSPTIDAKNLGADRTDLQTDQYHDDLANIWWTRG
jgi:hypothetical protein